jgi:hypothetical protein
MPYYEFYCSKNHRIYTFFARSLAHAGKVPRCPDNLEWSLEKRVSRFAVVGRAKEPAADAGGDEFDHPQMAAAMAELEREMAGLDEDHPDPRQLARLMRRMGELSGEPMDEAMREVIGRLEAGEDPDALDERMGEAFDDDPAAAGDLGGPADEERGPAAKFARLLGRRSRPPERDARVFDLEDWL